MNYVIAYDLGTGGTKASLVNTDGDIVSSIFVSCETYFPRDDFREQNPKEWWDGVVQATTQLLKAVDIKREQIKGIGVSGHSLGVVPIDQKGHLLSHSVPIWSDGRADEEAKEFFTEIDQKEWYYKTGNGFPPKLYAIFKIMWYKKNESSLYHKAKTFLGTKDYINYKLTGNIATDSSNASGSGVFDLNRGIYDSTLIKASGVELEKLPIILDSDDIVGTLTKEVAENLGLPQSVKVVCGGVDNACMALGANCKSNGQSYTSLGTSAWIAVSHDKPILNDYYKPYVFAHCIKGQYVSATAIFSAGNSYRWVKNQICKDLIHKAKAINMDPYSLMNDEAAKAPIGCNGLIFNPSLAGGSSLDESVHIQGAYVGLSLSHKREEMIRSAMEGIAMNLKLALDILENNITLEEDMLIVGGGAKSSLWMSIFADVFNKSIKTSEVGQNAGSLGAAALALVGTKLWKDYSMLNNVMIPDIKTEPLDERVQYYKRLLGVFKNVSKMQSKLGDLIKTLKG